MEDRRRISGRRIAGFGGGGIGIVIIVVIILLGGNPMELLQVMEQEGTGLQTSGTTQTTPYEDELADFVSVVLADTETVWGSIFAEAGASYQEPQLVLYRDQVRSACGLSSSATGPFYCPGDSMVYLDLGFFEQMERALHAGGDFAQAYVIAHEVGHHVQNLLGTSDQVHQARGRISDTEYNQLSVRLELQADFLAGVWAHHAQANWNILEEGDVEEALNAATMIGDDRLQKQAQGYVVPESFTHGTSEQRMRWFSRGLQSGDMTEGNTFELGYNEL